MGNIDWGLTANVVFSGLIIVFIALIMLILLVMLTGKAIGMKKPAPQTPAPSPASPPPQPVRVPQAQAPQVPQADGGQVIAAITAAVGEYMSETAPGTAYAVTGISPAARPGREKGARPAWGFAGMRQNTEPF